MKRLSLVLVIGLGLILIVGGAFAASDTKDLTINAQVSSRAKLTLGETAINFPDADPDTVLSIPAAENAVSVTVKVKIAAGSTATLTHQAAGDLTSGSDTIDITNVTWTATGGGFQAGTMDDATPQTAGSWTSSGNRSGTFSYFLANSWDHATGNYTVNSTYTLTAP